MRITFILPVVNMSGGIRVVAIYAKALAEKGHDVVLISPPRPNTPVRQKIKSLITGRGWPANSQPDSHLDGLGLDHRVLDRCRPVMDIDVPDADVVIATWWETAEWVNAMSDRKGVKIYFIQHHEVHEHLDAERSSATYNLPLHKIVISKWLLDLMVTKYCDTDVDMVYNSVDHTQFFSDARKRQAEPTVGFLYSTAKFKGVEVTIQAINKLRVTFPSLRVLSFGTEKPDERLPLPSYVEFYRLPSQDRIREIYSCCDVWLCGSRSEGFHLPPLEAMACRTPVVSTKVGGPVDILVNGLNGILVDVDDMNGLIRGVEWVLELPENEWVDLSNRAYETATSNTWQKAADQFEKALEHAIRRDKNMDDIPTLT